MTPGRRRRRTNREHREIPLLHPASPKRFAGSRIESKSRRDGRDSAAPSTDGSSHVARQPSLRDFHQSSAFPAVRPHQFSVANGEGGARRSARAADWHTSWTGESLSSATPCFSGSCSFQRRARSDAPHLWVPAVALNTYSRRGTSGSVYNVRNRSTCSSFANRIRISFFSN